MTALAQVHPDQKHDAKEVLESDAVRKILSLGIAKQFIIDTIIKCFNRNTSKHSSII